MCVCVCVACVCILQKSLIFVGIFGRISGHTATPEITATQSLYHCNISATSLQQNPYNTATNTWLTTLQHTFSSLQHIMCTRVTWLICTRVTWLICTRVTWLTCTRVTWLIHTCDMTHMHTCDMTHMHTCDMTHSQQAFILRLCDLTHVHVLPDAFKYVTHFAYSRHSNAWHDPFIHVTCTIHTCDDERWGAEVEYHFQEISWALRPVVNGT